MKKTYLVKKYPDMPESEENWIMMNGYEFARFMKTEDGKKRKLNFAQLDSCGEGDDIVVVECGEKKSKEWRADKDAHDYITEQEVKSNVVVVSYDALDSEDEDTIGEELIADDYDLVADIISKIDREKLCEALKKLKPEELKLLSLLYLIDEPLTEAEYAGQKGVRHQTIHVLKKRALMKLKKYFQ